MKEIKELTLADFEMVHDGYYKCEGINKANYILNLVRMSRRLSFLKKEGWTWILLNSDRDVICMSDTYNRRPSLALSNCKRRLKELIKNEKD